jgi:hypothetical protein
LNAGLRSAALDHGCAVALIHPDQQFKALEILVGIQLTSAVIQREPVSLCDLHTPGIGTGADVPCSRTAGVDFKTIRNAATNCEIFKDHASKRRTTDVPEADKQDSAAWRMH